jgi:hypothetical protein
LNFNNMSFTRLLAISHFMHVQGTEITTKPKNEKFSMQE